MQRLEEQEWYIFCLHSCTMITFNNNMVYESYCLLSPPKVLLFCRSWGACVPRRSQRLCQLEFWLLVGATMLDRLWARGQTKCNTPLMLATSVFGRIHRRPYYVMIFDFPANAPQPRGRGSSQGDKSSKRDPKFTSKRDEGSTSSANGGRNRGPLNRHYSPKMPNQSTKSSATKKNINNKTYTVASVYIPPSESLN